MFLVEKNTPDVYVNESRDFQLLARLYDLVFQASRFSIDSMNYISDTMRCNEDLLKLLGTKLGFFSDTTVTDYTYRKILATFPHIIKYKGSLKAIELVVSLFEKITNTRVILNTANVISDSVLNVQLENSSIYDNKLFHELVEYVRPVGLLINYEIYVPPVKEPSRTYVSSKAYVMNYSPILTDVNDSDDESIAGIVSTKDTPTQNKNLNSPNSTVNNTVGFTYVSNSVPSNSNTTTQEN